MLNQLFIICSANSGFDITLLVSIIETLIVWQFFSVILLLAVIYLLITRKSRINKIRQFVERRTNTILNQKTKIEEQKLLLERENEKSEDLLKDVFPTKIAKVLKNKGKIEPEYYEQASILFADIVSFSKITPDLTAEELVDTLNLYFKAFDTHITENKMILIKTIGDSYFAVGGVPKKDKKNPIYTVIAGLQMQKSVKELNLNSDSKWKVRVGINTGEIAAGVLDTKRPMFDVWGSAVNVASRLQENGESGRVNISESTYKCIYPYFECEERGEIEGKNIGKIPMYFVKRIKPAFSEDEEGTVPNKLFWKYVKSLKDIKPDYIKLTQDVIELLKEKLPNGIYYHTEKHALNIMSAVEVLCFGEKIFNEDILLLKTAALLHDVGFIERYNNNEEIGARYAREMLPNYDFNVEQINKVEKLILATEITYKPKNLLERIIRDADLDYLGRSDFEDISQKLMKEFLEHGIVQSEKEFLENQVKFLISHKFLTETAKNTRIKKKKENIEIAKKLNDS